MISNKWMPAQRVGINVGGTASQTARPMRGEPSFFIPFFEVSFHGDAGAEGHE
jgi:hypothetical protein